MLNRNSIATNIQLISASQSINSTREGNLNSWEKSAPMHALLSANLPLIKNTNCLPNLGISFRMECRRMPFSPYKPWLALDGNCSRTKKKIPTQRLFVPVDNLPIFAAIRRSWLPRLLITTKSIFPEFAFVDYWHVPFTSYTGSTITNGIRETTECGITSHETFNCKWAQQKRNQRSSRRGPAPSTTNEWRTRESAR